MGCIMYMILYKHLCIQVYYHEMRVTEDPGSGIEFQRCAPGRFFHVDTDKRDRGMT